MIEYINSLLSPVEKIIKSNRKYIGYFLIFLSVLSLGYLFFPNSTKDIWENAYFVLWVILWIPIFSRVFWLNIAKSILPLRKELGILMGILVLIHWLGYISIFPAYMLDKGFWWSNWFISYLACGFFALFLTIPLLLTSNNWAIHKLWKNWKYLHRLIYIIIIIVVVHVVLINYSREFDIVPVIMLILYFVFKWLEWKWIKLYKEEARSYPKWQLWLCVPCGYIYDPIFGDTDSGIVVGTEFVDIPDNWRCPVCGVTKSDFIPYTWDEIITEWARVIQKSYLNATTIELTIETEKSYTSTPGQFIWFFWQDQEWTFQRSYSIVKQDNNEFTFTIKLNPFGRWARIIEWLSIWDKIRINGVFGNFLLQKWDNPKVFIATGTWLAPIYNMLLSLKAETKKILYFSVATEGELFYIEKLKNIKNLGLYIHVTRESIEWYETGRVDIETIKATPDTEWYLCGNPKMITEAIEKLKKRGFEKIYSEEF